MSGIIKPGDKKIVKSSSQRLDDLEQALAYQFELITVLKETLEAIASGLQKGNLDGKSTEE
jgi:uncharacterized coiled-coil protein SlyX